MTIQVCLLSHTPDPEKAVARAIRLCYSPRSILELDSSLAGKDLSVLLRKVISLGHHSVLEHASFTFGIEGVSRVMTHQLVRHRLASYSQQSQRYVEFKDSLEVVVPESIKRDRGFYRRYLKHCREAFSIYRDMCEGGIPAEDARYLFPSVAQTKIIVTMNARELRHFFRIRCCERAQWEIRGVAERMVGLVRDVAPSLFADSGPSCIGGPCPEGDMTCGRIKEVKARYRALKTAPSPKAQDPV